MKYIQSFYYYLLDFKAIHPFRFLGLLFVIIFLFSYLSYKLANGKKINLNFSKKGLYIINIIQFTIIIILIALLSSETKIENKPENISLSSSEYIFGIDVSHYQGKINWNEVRTSHHPIEFVFIRSTMGKNGQDTHFKRNWKESKEKGFITGAYHYYRPNENSTQQFENYKNSVELSKGDFIPILDIEKESKYGRENLREGVLNWLKLAEEEYGVKPMIYTGLNFFQNVLEGYVNDYPIWVAAYSGKERINKIDWSFHQFTENIRVKGINTSVDGNDFKGSFDELKNYCID